jgi:2-desacetyl-2-hydroxyethyl bacteriochlorophyllide A dehydrogenase
MRAFVITAPGSADIIDVPDPDPAPGQVTVDIERAGICGTDMEFFAGTMTYLHTGEARYPIRIGHEWSGTVSAAAPDVDPSWLGRRVTADTMLGCGHCHRCTSGRQHLCADRHEIGIRHGWPGALAEKLAVPARALHPLPHPVDPTLGALVEPGGNALRSVRAAQLSPGSRLLILGPGTIGLLAAQIATAHGAEVHLLARDEPSLAFPRSLNLGPVWTAETLPDTPFDAIIDASNSPALPALALDLVEPGGRIVYIGLSGEPSRIDTRTIVLKDVTVVGVLSASGGLAGTIKLYASGSVDPRPLVAATLTLEEAATALSGERRPEWGAAPKIHIDPRCG